MNQELLKKVREAKTPEELLQLAHENGIADFTEENAKAYFEAMHRSGELADEELNVSAGGCFSNPYAPPEGFKKVNATFRCNKWVCNQCYKDKYNCQCYGKPNTPENIVHKLCHICAHCVFAYYADRYDGNFYCSKGL